MDRNESKVTIFDCPICFFTFSSDNKSLLYPTFTLCGHVFCSGCSGRLIGRCPTCREPLKFNEAPVYAFISAIDYVKTLEEKITNLSETKSQQHIGENPCDTCFDKFIAKNIPRLSPFEALRENVNDLCSHCQGIVYGSTIPDSPIQKKDQTAKFKIQSEILSRSDEDSKDQSHYDAEDSFSEYSGKVAKPKLSANEEIKRRLAGTKISFCLV
jgi:hypothetical protein